MWLGDLGRVEPAVHVQAALVFTWGLLIRAEPFWAQQAQLLEL